MNRIKHKLIFFVFFSLLTTVFVVAHNNGESGSTGAPSENTCAKSGCHNSYPANSGTGSILISSDIPASGYVPGTTYNISVTVAQTGVSLFGFDLVALNPGGNSTGTLVITNAASTQLITDANGRINITHTNGGGASNNSKVFNFNWTAPSPGVGTVTFYSAGNATNNNNNAMGDYIYNTNKAYTQAVSNTITTGTVSGSPFCQGATGINIPYTITGAFNGGNVFTAQLSDPTGSFTTSTNLGTLTSTTSGTIVSSVGLPAIAGTNYKIRVISSSPAITGTTSTSVLTINLTPTTSNAGLDQTVCTNSATLSGNVPTVGTGQWSLVSGSGTITNINIASSGVTGLGSGANKFVWTISNVPCTPSRDTVTITYSGTITPSNAGLDQLICGTTTSLSGNVPTVGTGQWSLASGSGTITTPSSATSSVTGLGVGTNKFVWTISNPPCTPSTDTVSIVVSASPTASNAGVDQSICGTTTNLSGNIPTVGTGQWSLVSGSGTITSASSATSGVTGLGVGANKFVWTISNAPCVPSKDTVTINVVTSPTTSNAGSDQLLCGSTTNLSGNVPTVGIGQWSLSSGSGTITTPNSATTSVTGLGIGTNRFVWTINNAPCPSSTDTVLIIVNAPPTTSNAGIDQTVCTNSANLSGNVPTVGTGQWSLLSGSGTITNINSTSSDVTGLGSGANKFVWTISNAPCTPSRDTVTITYSGTITPSNAGLDQQICGTTTNLSGNIPTVGTGQWSLASGSGT
ncbi:MAG: hypothetical protein K1X55_16580, partial [Chitinophagales bacterium]|nr:hypothetical protein [Chitinophagales bacterium]